MTSVSSTNFFDNYFDKHTPQDGKSPQDGKFIKPVERARIARYADIGGMIPFLGMGVGVIRMISSAVIGIIAFIGMELTKEGKAFKYWGHVKQRAGGECTKGSLEIAGFGILNFVVHFDAKKEEPKGLILPYTYGRYVYEKDGMLFYSNIKFEGYAIKRGDEYEGYELQFDDDAVSAQKSNSTQLL